MLYDAYKKRMLKLHKVWLSVVKRRVPILVSLTAITVLLTAFLTCNGMIIADASLTTPVVKYGEKISVAAKSLFSEPDFEYRAANSDTWTSEEPVRAGDYFLRTVSKRTIGRQYGKELAFTIAPRNTEIVLDCANILYYGDTPEYSVELVNGDKVASIGFTYPENIEKTAENLWKADFSINSDNIKIVDKSDVDVTDCYAFSFEKTSGVFGRKAATVTTTGGEKVFDGNGASFCEFDAENLAYGDICNIDETAYNEFLHAGTYKNEVDFSAVAFTNKAGEDVTAFYDYSVSFGTIEIKPLDITITAGSEIKVYDGAELKCENSEITGDNRLIDGYFYTATFDNQSVITDVGKTKNKISAVKVTDINGNDFTSDYNFTFIDGELEVTLRPIIIETEDAGKQYDGDPVYAERFNIINDTSIVDGHKVELEYFGYINAGEYDNLPVNACIYDQNGKNVTANYSIDFVCGKLTIAKRIVTYRTPTKEFIYSGKPYFATDGVFEQGTSLAGGESCVAVDYTTVTFVTDKPVENVYTLKIIKADGEDSSANYEIIYNIGALSVVSRKITVTTESGSAIYDGKPHTFENVTVADVNTDYGELNAELADNHEFDYVFTGTTFVTEGTRKNNVEITVLLNGENVTENFDIGLIGGDIYIEKRPMTVVLESNEKFYDGEATKWTYFYATELEPADGDIVTIPESAFTAFEDAGGHDNFVSLKELCVTNGDENRKPNYDITLISGHIIIKQRPIYLQTFDLEKIYDGKTFEVIRKHVITFGYEHDDKKEGVDDGLVKDHRAIVDYSTDDRPKYAGNYIGENKAEITALTDKYGNDVSKNYEICEPKFGNLLINKRPISIVTGSRSFEYNGDFNSCCDWDYAENSLRAVEGDEPVALTASGVRDVTEQPEDNEITLRFICSSGGNDMDVTFCYDVTISEYGKLTVYARKIKITIESDQKVYDGTPLICGEATADRLVSGHSIYPKDGEIPSITEVGSTDNMFDVTIACSQDGKYADVTKNYEITEIVKGTLTVTQRTVIIRTADETGEYSGQYMHGTTVCVDENSPYNFAAGQYPVIDESKPYTQFFKTGVYQNVFEIKVLSVMDIYQSEDCTPNYDIQYAGYGTFEVTKRRITVVNYDTAKVYDGYNVDVGYGIEYGTESDHTDTIKALVNDDYISDYVIAETPFRAGKYSLSVYEIVKISAKADDSDITDCYEISYANATVIIEKRPITLESESSTKLYDGNPFVYAVVKIVEGSLAETDKVIYTEYTSVTEVGEYDNKFIAIFKHYNTERQDYKDIVDECYEVTYRYGTLTILAKSIFVKTSSDTRKYDGVYHSYPEYTVVNSADKPVELPDGVSLEVGDKTYVRDAGTYRNELSFIVWLNGKVTYSYKVEIREYGMLTVLPRELWLKTPDESFEYDGKEHYGTPSDDMIIPDYGDGIADGQKATVSADTANYVVFVGDEAENRICVTITDADGYDATKNYTIGYLDTGMLGVTKRPIKVTGESYTKEYDGKDFDVSKMLWSVTYKGEGSNKAALGKDDRGVITAKNEGKFLPGTYDNEAELKIVSYYYRDNGGRKDVTFCYEIENVPGVLTITPRKLVIYAESDRKLYDGTPLTCEKYSVYHYGDSEPALLHGEKMTVSFFTTKEKDRNTLNVEAIEPGVYYNQANILSIKDSAGNEVFEKNLGCKIPLYTIDVSGYECGTLEVLAKWRVEVSTVSKWKEYDGTPLTFNRAIVNYLPDGYTYDIIFDESSTITDPGRVKNKAKITIFDKNGNVVYSDDNDDEQNRFEVEYSFGSLIVTKRTLKINTGSKQKAYDGEPLVYDRYTVDGLLSGHFVKLKVTGSITDPGFVENSVEFYGIYDEAGNDVGDKYNVITDLGRLTVNDGKGFDPDPLPSGSDDDGGVIVPGDDTDLDDGKEPEFYFTANVTGDHLMKVLDYGAYDGKASWLSANDYNGLMTVSPDTLSALALLLSGAQVSTFTVEYTDVAAISYRVMPSYFYGFDDGLSNGFGGNFVYTENELSAAVLKKLWLGSEINESDYADYVYGEYLNVPAATKNKLYGIINSLGLSGYDKQSVEHKLEAIDAITNLFVSEYGYNEQFIKYPNNVDNVAYFLTQAKQGSRQQFASAGVMLLRMLGVPARYCAGYKAFTLAGEKYAVTGQDKYYWAEVYFNGVGWIKVDFESGTDFTPPSDLEQTMFYITTDAATNVVYLKSKDYGNYNFTGWGRAIEYVGDEYISPERLTTTALLNYGKNASTARIDYVDGLKLSNKFAPTYFDRYLDEDSGGYSASFVAGTELWQMYDIGSLSHLGELAEFEKNYADFVYDNYLAVPEDTRNAIANIASSIGGEANGRLSNAQKINVIMRTVSLLKTYKYNINFKHEEQWTDNVAGFLNSSSKEGICQQFASAGTVLLRMLGVPARYCTGYAAKVKAGQTSAVTGMDGHAWCEAYFDGIGWLEVEFTVGTPVGGSELPVGGEEDDREPIYPDYPKQGWIIVDTSSINLKKKYDGTPLTFDFDPNTMIVDISLRNEGDQIRIVSVSDRTEIGKCGCTITIEVLDSSGKNVTAYYEVLYVGCGTLSVTN